MPGAKFIQSAITKPGALRSQLNVKSGQKIPKTFLNKIADAPVDTRVTNPTKTGKKSVKVTKLLKRRASLARTLSKLK